MAGNIGAPQLKPYHFKPGQSGNLGGRPRIPPELKTIRSLNSEELCKLISKFGRMNLDEIRVFLQDTTTPNIEATVANLWLQARTKASLQHFAILMDRSVGKVKDMEETTDETESVTITKDNLKELYDIARTA